MLIKEIPFLRICLPLCAGIVSGHYVCPGTALIIISAILIASGFSFSLLFNRSEVNIIYGCSFAITLFLCGLMMYTLEKRGLTTLDSKPSVFTCTLSDYPVEKASSYLLSVRLDSRINGKESEPVNGSMLLYHRKDSLVQGFLPGDLLIIKCTPVQIAGRGNPCEFDYRFYVENQGIRYYAFTSSRSILSHADPKHRKMIHKALIIREKIIQMYRESGITGERLALVAAITLGQKNMLDSGQKNYFIKAGVMHIMAVSGLHTVILSLFVFYLLFFLKKRFNIVRILLTIGFLWSFAFVTGLTPSVLRATIMFSFLQAGNLMKRPVNAINSVLASGFVLILIRPSVIFDAGFLLSYSAVIYIIAFYSDLYQKLEFKSWISDKIWQSASVTIVAQAGTLPLTIALFNRFPTYFILTNLIIVPLSSLLVIVGCIIPMLFPLKFLSHFLAMILSNLTGLTELLTRTASSLPMASIENVGMTNAECILFTVFIFLLSYSVLKEKGFSAVYPMAALLIFLIAGTTREISTRITNELIVYNTPGFSTIGIRTGKILNIYSDTSVAGADVKRHCATLDLNLKMNNTGNRNQCITAGNTKILIAGYLDKNIFEMFSPDIVILTGAKPVLDPEIVSGSNPELTLIASEGLPRFIHYHNKRTLNTNQVYLVKKSGAFIRRI